MLCIAMRYTRRLAHLRTTDQARLTCLSGEGWSLACEYMSYSHESIHATCRVSSYIFLYTHRLEPLALICIYTLYGLRFKLQSTSCDCLGFSGHARYWRQMSVAGVLYVHGLDLHHGSTPVP